MTQDSLFSSEIKRANRPRRKVTLGPTDWKRFPEDAIHTEADFLRLLDTGVYHLDNLYGIADQLGLADRLGGRGKRSTGHLISHHHMRSALSGVKKQGRAEPLGNGWWAIEGTHREPTHAVFVVMGRASEITLMLGKAIETIKHTPGPVSLFVTDPPWDKKFRQGAEATRGHDRYGRPDESVVKGYFEKPEDVPYFEWSCEWLEAVRDVLEPGRFIAINTDARNAAAVQLAGESVGLEYNNQLIKPKPSGVAHGRTGYATAHSVVTLLTKGPTNKNTPFNLLPQHHRDREGQPMPITTLGPYPGWDRRGRMTYPTQQNPYFVSELVQTLSNERELVMDPFGGSFTTAKVCLFTNRRFFGGDQNPEALRYFMAQMVSIFEQEVPQLGDVHTMEHAGVQDFLSL